MTKRDKIIFSMLIPVVGVSLWVGFTNQPGSDEDLRTCSDARFAHEQFIQEFINTEESQRFWSQKSVAKDLRDLTGRGISSSLKDALVADAYRIQDSDEDLPLLDQVSDFCNSNFGPTW
jgi:hypothetical protein